MEPQLHQAQRLRLLALLGCIVGPLASARGDGDAAPPAADDGTGDDFPPFETNTVPVAGLSAGVTAVSTSFSHTCLVVDGGVMCWGDNTDGELGDMARFARYEPVQVVGLTEGATAVAAGGYHSCAVVKGAVKCWGADWSGQLGATNAGPSFVPVRVLFD